MYSTIFEAIKANDLAAVREFIGSGIDLSMFEQEKQCTALSLAIELECDHDIIDLLLSQEQDFEQATKNSHDVSHGNADSFKTLYHSMRLLENKNKSIEPEAIAIIGMGARFPGVAENISSFWKMLSKEKDMTTEVPFDRWPVEQYFSSETGDPGKTYTKHGAFIRQNIQEFDADFFKISPKEAKYLDPQQRLLMEVVWEALEEAHLSPEQLNQSDTGVYIGIAAQDYAALLGQLNITEASTAYTASGNALSVAAGRIAYWLGCQGPTMSIETACSSSLVALHQACHSIHSGEARMAIVGGVNLLLSPSSFVNFSQAGMLSADGKCKTFDESADGYGRGEGCGVVILKSLSQAQADNDNILAVIKSSAVNQDGASSGLTVPNGPAQEKLIRTALKQANLNPNDIDYIEAHGTGTSLGDPIELNALKAVFSTDTPREQPLIVGTAKTYIGHLEAAAGMAGLVKTILSMQHQQVPKLLHFKQLNPHIQLNENIQLPLEAQAWRARENHVRRAGVSSFGFSGTNAHVIIEEAPTFSLNDELAMDTGAQLVVFSAKSEAALEALKEKYLTYLSETEDCLSNIAYTSAMGRSHFKLRIAVIAVTKEELIDKLRNSTGAFTEESTELHLLAMSYLSGEMIDWKAYYIQKPYQYKKVSLPTYAFQRERYWAIPDEMNVSYDGVQLKKTSNPFLEGPFSVGNGEQVYVHTLTKNEVSALANHIIFDTPIMPGSGYMGLMLMACQAYQQRDTIECNDIEIIAPMVIESGVHYQIVLQATDDKAHVSFYSSHPSNKSWQCHAKAVFKTTEPSLSREENVSLQSLFDECPQAISKVDFYAGLRKRGYNYQGDFQRVEEFYYGEGVLLAKIVSGASRQGVSLDPVFLDVCLHAGLGNLLIHDMPLDEAYLPIGVEHIQVYSALPDVCYVSSRWLVQEINKSHGRADTILYDADGAMVARFEGLLTKQTTASHLRHFISQSTAKEHTPELTLTYVPQWEKLPSVSRAMTDTISQDAWVVIVENATSLPLLQARLTPLFSSIQYICLETLTRTEKEAFLVFISDSSSLSVLYYCDASAPSLKICHQLLEWTQQLSTILQQTSSRFWVITTQANAVPENSLPINLSQVAVKGFMRSLVLERPADIKHIDIEADLETSLISLIPEMLSPSAHSELCYRDHQSWIEYLVPQKRLHSVPLVIQSEKTYLITGGLGGIGSSLCHWLLNKGAKHIALFDCREMDAAKQAQLLHWSADSKHVTYYRGDIASEADVKSVLDSLNETMPAVVGVFHTAGIAQVNFLLAQKPGDFTASFDSKVVGTELLYRELTIRYTESFEFMVLFSSISSFLGFPGMLSYAASNAFMDGFACAMQRDPQHACRVLSLNWGPWAEVGMVTQLQGENTTSRFGFIPILPTRAFDILESALSDSQVLAMSVVEINWEEAHRFMPKMMQRVREIGIKKSIAERERHSNSVWLKEMMSKVENERLLFVKEKLVQIVSSVIGFSPHQLNEHTGFVEMGLDSLMAASLRNNVQRWLGDAVLLASTVIFDYPSIAQLSTHIYEQLQKINPQLGASKESQEIQIPKNHLPPRTIVEEALVGVFKEALSIKELGVLDNVVDTKKVTLAQWVKIYLQVGIKIKELQKSVFKKTTEEKTAILDTAVIFQKINIAEMALYISCFLEFNSPIDNDSLFTWVKNGNKKLIVSSLEKKVKDINMSDLNGKTCLHLVVQLGTIDMVLWLLSKGANPNKTTVLNITPLALALFSQQLDMVIEFLKYLPNMDQSIFSLTSDENMTKCLLGAFFARIFITDSTLEWVMPFKENLRFGRLFFEGIQTENITRLMSFVPKSRFFIEHLGLFAQKSTGSSELTASDNVPKLLEYES